MNLAPVVNRVPVETMDPRRGGMGGRVPVETLDPRRGGMGGHFQAPHDG